MQPWDQTPSSGVLGEKRPRRTALLILLSVTLAPAFVVGVADDAVRRPESESAQTTAPLGQELFHREWVAGDSRSPGGDGLGPVYNETSCVACHNLGGAGGAGPASKNAVILTALATAPSPGGSPRTHQPTAKSTVTPGSKRPPAFPFITSASTPSMRTGG